MRRILSEKQKQILWLCILAIGFAVLFYFILARSASVSLIFQRIFSVVLPFLIGAMFAFILKPICNFFDVKLGELFTKKIYRKRIESGIDTENRIHRKAEKYSVLIAMIIFVLIIAGILWLVLPSLYSSITTLISSLPSYIEDFDDYLINLDASDNELVSIIQNYYLQIRDSLNEVVSNLINTFFNSTLDIIASVTNLVTTTLSFLVNILVTTVSIVYVLLNRKRFAAQLNMITRAIFPKKGSEWLVKEAHFADQKFSEFFSGKLLDSMVVGIILYILFVIFKIPQAPLIATFMAFCNMIPFFGPYIGSIPCIFIVFVSEISNPWNVLYFLIIVVIVQQLDGNILDPYIVGDNIGLSSFWVLFAVILFGDLFGFFGLLIGVPLFAIIYDIIRQLVNFGLSKRNEMELVTNYNFIYHNPFEERAERKKRSHEIKQKRAESRKIQAAKAKEAAEHDLLEAKQQVEDLKRQEMEAQMVRDQDGQLSFDDEIDALSQTEFEVEDTEDPIETEDAPKEEDTPKE